MELKINEDSLCVLRLNKLTNLIEVDYVTIEKPLIEVINKFSALCENPNSSLKEIVQFIRNTDELNQLQNHYRYCQLLDSAFQAFHANNELLIKEIEAKEEVIIFKSNLEEENYDAENETREYKLFLKAIYILWNNAFSINKTYRLCYEDKSVLTFSHRIDGWSNPVYQLTPNFTVEIKTNFGYGRASYFFTKLKYKNIEITPFSEWITYEFAKIHEIIRYSKSHLIENKYWAEAMEYAKKASNLSLTNEAKFVEKYIVEECEIMVSGLENIFSIDHFKFKNRNQNGNEISIVNKEGHELIEFRGEKISGALDFISKIIEFQNVTSVSKFIKRIEFCNKKIQPILVEEEKILKIKISNLVEDKQQLQPIYDKLRDENHNYNLKKGELQNQMISNKQLDIENIDIIKLNKKFDTIYPDYKEFKIKYDEISKNIDSLSKTIHKCTTIKNNIVAYNNKIEAHFTSN